MSNCPTGRLQLPMPVQLSMVDSPGSSLSVDGGRFSLYLTLRESLLPEGAPFSTVEDRGARPSNVRFSSGQHAGVESRVFVSASPFDSTSESGSTSPVHLRRCSSSFGRRVSLSSSPLPCACLPALMHKNSFYQLASLARIICSLAHCLRLVVLQRGQKCHVCTLLNPTIKFYHVHVDSLRRLISVDGGRFSV